MKKTLLLLIFSFQFSLWSQSNCAEAIAIEPGNHTVGTISGTPPTTFCAPNGSATAAVWYRYTPTTSSTVTLTTDLQENASNSRDTRFHVYTGNCGNLTCFAGDDDGGVLGNGFLSTATFLVTANTTYYIAFDNRWQNSSNFIFQLTLGQVQDPSPTGTITFTNVALPTVNSQYNIAVVDMNGDYLDDILGVSSTNIKVHAQTSTGGFDVLNFPTTSAENLPSWSMAVADFNKDGHNDLMYGGGSGVTFMKSTAGGSAYVQESFPEYVFCQRTNFVDLNNDGNLDAFSCHDVQPNVYFLNDGTGTLTFYQSNVTAGAMALGIHPNGGNYGSIWIDYDNDGDQDLFIAKCRGGSGTAKFNELHRNNGNGTFTDVSVAAGLYDPLQTWSAAWADFDNDGDMDVIVGASSTSDGSHKYMRNNGNGTFTDITAGSGWDTNTSTNIEHIAHDFDNDGFVDVMGGGSKIMKNNGDGTFSAVAVGFGVAAVGDLNNDGFLDFQTGATLRINNGNSNNWIKLSLQGVQSNRNGIGARVEIYGSWGKQIRDVRSGDGFKFMSSLNVHFGIGQATQITQVIVRWPSGIVDVFENPTINQRLHVVEGVTLSTPTVNTEAFQIFPNPASHTIQIKAPASKSIVSVEIFDTLGKRVLQTPVVNESVTIQHLNQGAYILVAKDQEGNITSHKFIKN